MAREKLQQAESAAAEQAVSLGRLSDFLGFQLKRLHNEMTRDLDRRTRHLRVRRGMLGMLELINVNPGISQALLGLEMGIDKSAVGLLADELVDRGFVVRRRSARDRRHYELTITEEGSAVLDQLFIELASTEREALSALDPHEVVAISKYLEKIYKAYVSEGT